MNRSSKNSVVLIVFILGNLTGITQNSGIMLDKSAESWSIAELRYYPSKNFRFGIEQQLRCNENGSAFDRTFTELNGRYSIRLGSERSIESIVVETKVNLIRRYDWPNL